MRRALLIAAGLVVALPIAGVTAAQFYLNQDALRARVEAAVQKATGRALTIAGPIRLSWSLTPTIEASDISLANPPGFSRPEMAHVDRVEAKLAVLKLFSRRVEVSDVTLAGPEILFERDAAGRPNWEFAKAAPASAPSAAPAQSGPRFELDIGEVALRDAKLGYKGSSLFEAALPLLTYEPVSHRFDGDVAFRGKTLHVAGTAAPMPFYLHIEGVGLTLAIAGSGEAAALTADVADLASLSTLTGAKLPALQNVQFATKATFASGSLVLQGLRLTSTQGDLAGNLSLSAVPRPTLRGALTSTHLDVDALTPPPPAPSAAPAPAPAAPPPATERLIPDTSIPYAELRRADADLQLNAAALTWHGKQYSRVVAHILLQDGKLRLNPASMGLGDKTLSTEFEADAGSQTLAAKLDAPGLPAGAVAALLGGPSAGGALDTHLDLRGQGSTWRAVAATLQGSAGLAMVDGEIDNGWVLGKLQGALRAANLPIPPGGDSKVRCAALLIEAESGELNLRALTLDTRELKLDGNGTINLADETLDLHLHPTLRLGAALTVPVHVGGTLLTPKAALDSGALEPGRVGISIGGPPPADTCGPALALARGGQAGPLPAAPAATRAPKPADLLRGLLR